MNYVFQQYNHTKGIDKTQDFLTLTTMGNPIRIKSISDSQVIGGKGFEYFDEGIYVGNLKRGVNYYFHGKIKRMQGDVHQQFDIKLINKDDNTSEREQFIKRIVVTGGETDSEWVSVDFIFTPIVEFDTILFKLNRDISLKDRHPIIIYEELSVINNIISKLNLAEEGYPLIKIGVQSHPGMLMCINGQPIIVGKSGIYEIRNGIIKVNTFSVVAPAKETEVDIEALQERLANMGENPDPEYTTSVCLFDKPKEREINSFILDYMYDKESEE